MKAFSWFLAGMGTMLIIMMAYLVASGYRVHREVIRSGGGEDPRDGLPMKEVKRRYGPRDQP